GETWDYTACQQMILTEITIDGQKRKVILQAPKNGVFYVIDRTTGTLISAKPYTQITWATGIDVKTGRPIEAPTGRYYDGTEPLPIVPGPLGAHTWQPMSYSPLTGLVYIPVQDAGFLYKASDNFQAKKLAPNYGIDVVAAAMPQDPKVKRAILGNVN